MIWGDIVHVTALGKLIGLSRVIFKGGNHPFVICNHVFLKFSLNYSSIERLFKEIHTFYF